MKKFAKALLALTFIASLVVITWGTLPASKKQELISLFNLVIQRIQTILPKKDDNNSPLTGIKKSLNKLTPNEEDSGLTLFSESYEQHALPRLCLKVNTRSIDDVDKTSIYKWKDENGQVHFSDSKPKTQKSHNVTEQYASKTQYFRMNLSSPDQGIPTLLDEQLQRDMNAIYGYISDRLAKQYLRQVDLNLKVFSTAQRFDQYRAQNAPSLRSVAGFYTTKNNEAVVMQQKHDKQTRAVARHEATHVINAGLFGHSPIWFNEGIAEYFESYTYAELKNRITHKNAYHLRTLSNLMQEGQLPDLTAYLQLSDKAWRKQEQSTMYAMAWSIIYALLQHSEGEKFMRALLKQMAEQPCQDLDVIEFWNVHYQGGLKKFEARWEAMMPNA